MIIPWRHRDLGKAAVERDVPTLAIGVGHDIPLTAAVGEVFWLEVDVVVAVVDEGEVVFVIVYVYVHIFVSIHVLVDL